jgi:acyl carrier protein
MLNQKLVEIVSRTFNVSPSLVTPETSPENTSAWDSIGHLNLILELEDEFQVRFPTEQIPELNSVARIQEALAQQST